MQPSLGFLRSVLLSGLCLTYRVRREYSVQSEYEANIFCEANKAGFIRLFRNEANQQILHAKRIKPEENICLKANILFISLQSQYFEAK
jgi:hypothetical protein